MAGCRWPANRLAAQQVSGLHGRESWPGDPPPGETESMGVASTDGSAGALAQVVREFAYDDAGRMRQVRHDGVVAMDYLYNGKGERVHRAGGGQSVTTLYDESGKWLGDYAANGQPILQVIWMDDLPVGLLVGAGANQKLYYVQADGLGTPRVVIDPVRNVAVWNWDLAGEAFGDSAPNQDADGDGIAFVFDMRFPGQRYDSATGMSYNYFRDYEASSGRYVQSDPIGQTGGSGLYVYGLNQPAILIDPMGLQSSPGISDQFNPSGLRGNGEADYTTYFTNRFPNTIFGAMSTFRARIKKRICDKYFFKSGVAPGMNKGADDIDISPDMSRFGDVPQTAYERNVKIGFFELKTKDIKFTWDNRSNTCTACFFMILKFHSLLLYRTKF